MSRRYQQASTTTHIRSPRSWKAEVWLSGAAQIGLMLKGKRNKNGKKERMEKGRKSRDREKRRKGGSKEVKKK